MEEPKIKVSASSVRPSSSDGIKTSFVFPGTFSVDKKSPAELKHISDVTGQAPAGQSRGRTLVRCDSVLNIWNKMASFGLHL